MSRTLAVTLFGLVMACAAPCARGEKLVPFRSSGSAQLLDVPVPGGVVQALDVGRATHLGNFESVYDLAVSVDGLLVVFTGQFTSTIASGDTITFAVEVRLDMFTGGFTGEFTAIGGTGRFAGVSGGLVTTSGEVDMGTGRFTYQSEGFLPSVGATKRN